MRLINNTFLAPYFIFIKDENLLSDNELLKLLDLEEYSLIINVEERTLKGENLNKRYLYITEDEHWKHLMDDFFYTLWSDENIKIKLQELSQKFDIFCCSIGDTDESFSFAYYKKGTIIREYIVEDPHFNGGETVKNLGKAFSVEKEAFSKENKFDTVLSIAKSLGICIHHNLEKVRLYGRLENEQEKMMEAFIFNNNTSY